MLSRHTLFYQSKRTANLQNVNVDEEEDEEDQEDVNGDDNEIQEVQTLNILLDVHLSSPNQSNFIK